MAPEIAALETKRLHTAALYELLGCQELTLTSPEFWRCCLFLCYVSPNRWRICRKRDLRRHSLRRPSHINARSHQCLSSVEEYTRLVARSRHRPDSWPWVKESLTLSNRSRFAPSPGPIGGFLPCRQVSGRLGSAGVINGCNVGFTCSAEVWQFPKHYAIVYYGMSSEKACLTCDLIFLANGKL